MSTTSIALQLGHSPDPDDAFMWWPLVPDPATGRSPMPTGRFVFKTVTADIDALNRRSEKAELEITAVSCAQYPAICRRYAITACGASMGDAFGPKLVARLPLSLQELAARRVRVAVPGRRTSAFTALRLAPGLRDLPYAEVPFDQIIDRVAAGEFEAGLVIHEGQLTFEQRSLHLLLDLGQWWSQDTGLPLPLGVNVIRRDLDEIHGPGTIAAVTGVLAASVAFALKHREQALHYALQFGRGIDAALADRFVAMYVNRWTLDFGARGREAVSAFLGRAHEAGLLADPGEIDMVEPAAV